MKPISFWLLIIFSLAGCKKATDIAAQNTKTNTSAEDGVSIVGWGDSLTQGSGGDKQTYLTYLSGLTSLPTINRGIQSETSTQIKNRFIAEPGLHHYPTVIWAGRNNFKDSVTIKKDIAEMVAGLGHDHYIILGILNSDYYNERKNSPNYNRIISLNHQLAAIYCDHFIDIRTYLVSKYDPANPVDVENHDEDVTPSSLRADSLHMNAHGYYFVAKIINSNIKVLIDK